MLLIQKTISGTVEPSNKPRETTKGRKRKEGLGAPGCDVFELEAPHNSL
jgi:hypothetical protein